MAISTIGISMVCARVTMTIDCCPGRVALLARNFHLNRHTDLPGNWMADLPGDLARVLDWPLLALPLGVGVALGSSGVAMMDSVSIAGVGLPLAIAVSCVATMVDLGIVADHTRAVVDLLGHLVALLSHDILAVLDISGVH